MKQVIEILRCVGKTTEQTEKTCRTISRLIHEGELVLEADRIIMDKNVTFKTVYDTACTVTIANYPKKGSKTPSHMHTGVVEYFICNKGSFSVYFAENFRFLRAGECVAIGKDVKHSAIALEDDSELIAVCIPAEPAYVRKKNG